MGCLARVDEGAARLATELAVPEEFDGSVSAADTGIEIPAKAKPFIEVEAIAVNRNTTVELEASSGVAMGGTRP